MSSITNGFLAGLAFTEIQKTSEAMATLAVRATRPANPGGLRSADSAQLRELMAQLQEAQAEAERMRTLANVNYEAYRREQNWRESLQEHVDLLQAAIRWSTGANKPKP